MTSFTKLKLTPSDLKVADPAFCVRYFLSYKINMESKPGL